MPGHRYRSGTTNETLGENDMSDYDDNPATYPHGECPAWNYQTAHEVSRSMADGTSIMRKCDGSTWAFDMRPRDVLDVPALRRYVLIRSGQVHRLTRADESVSEYTVTVAIDVEATSDEDARREVGRIFNLAKGPDITWVRYGFTGD